VLLKRRWSFTTKLPNERARNLSAITAAITRPSAGSASANRFSTAGRDRGDFALLDVMVVSEFG